MNRIEDYLFMHLLAFFIDFQDALSLTEVELMELLDVGLAEVTKAVAHISEVVSPPYQTVSAECKGSL